MVTWKTLYPLRILYVLETLAYMAVFLQACLEPESSNLNMKTHRRKRYLYSMCLESFKTHRDHTYIHNEKKKKFHIIILI